MASNTNTQQDTRRQTETNPSIEKDRELIINARKRGGFATLKAFMRLSGPGWLQSGITVGGVTFSSSLYLGVLSGFTFLWLQPLGMMLGIVMLAAIAYVTLSSRQGSRRPGWQSRHQRFVTCFCRLRTLPSCF